MQTKTNGEIVKILYKHGHSTYHPALADELESYINSKLKPSENLAGLLVIKLEAALQSGDLDAVNTYSQVMQRLQLSYN